MVSQFNFFKSLSWDPFEGSFNDLFELFLQGKRNIFIDYFLSELTEVFTLLLFYLVWYGPWWKHIDSYTSLPTIKIIHYEDLLQRPFEKCKEMCDYLGQSLSDEQILSIIENSSFEKMKHNPALDFKRLIKMKIFNEDVDFFKNGKIGQWDAYFTEEMSQRLEEVLRKNLMYKTKFNYRHLKN